MTNVFEGVLYPNSKTPPKVHNPQTFTTDFVDGYFRFYRGHHSVAVSKEAVAMLLNSDNFYEDIDSLLKVSRYPEDAAAELTRLAAEAGILIKVYEATWDDGFNATFLPDLEQLDLRRTEPPRPIVDFKIVIRTNRYKIDWQAVYNDIVRQFNNVVASPWIEPALS